MLNNPFLFHCIALHEAEQSRSVRWLLLGTGAKAALEKAKSPTEEPMLTFHSTIKKPSGAPVNQISYFAHLTHMFYCTLRE